MRLGVNIDHVATVRELRKARYPNPVACAALAEKGGADQITVHLREDRRHIQEEDVRELRKDRRVPLNLEMAPTQKMVDFAIEVRPDVVTFVPERREERTTEDGLDVVQTESLLRKMIPQLKQQGIEISFFINPNPNQIDAVIRLAAERVEFHTGPFANAYDSGAFQKQLDLLKKSTDDALSKGLEVAAGHGLNYENAEELIRQIPQIDELNIGHSIISRALFVGLEGAVREMKEILDQVLSGSLRRAI